MSEWQFIFLLIIPLAHLLGGITAFGSSLVAVSVIVALGGRETLSDAVTILAICGLLQALMIVSERNRRIDWRTLRFVILLTLIGIPPGYLLASSISEGGLKVALGGLLILGGIAPFVSCLSKPMPRTLRMLALLLAGVIHGAFASGGTILIPYMRLTQKDKAAFRTTLAATWVVLNTGLVVLCLTRQSVATEKPLFLLVVCVGVVLFTRLGQYIASRINEERFARLASGAMVMAGVLYVAV